MRPLLHVTIPGIPQQQGSKRMVGRHLIEANKNLAPWRADAIHLLRTEAERAVLDADHPLQELPITGPVVVGVTFTWARPASHFRTGANAGLLKPNVPDYKTSAPDLDKLCRAVGDALTQAGVIRDDALIVTWNASKRWATQPLTIIGIIGAER